MRLFLNSPEWKELNVGFTLDEGLANPEDEFTVYFGERMPWSNKSIKTILFDQNETLSFLKNRSESELSWKSRTRIAFH